MFGGGVGATMVAVECECEWDGGWWECGRGKCVCEVGVAVGEGMEPGVDASLVTSSMFARRLLVIGA